MDKMRTIQTVAVTGGSGFIGRALIGALVERGYEVLPVGRLHGIVDPAPFEGADAVIHLAGESIDGRWTEAKKRAIYDSRIIGTRTLVDSLAACAVKPKVLICASATGFYGNRDDEPLDERSSGGSDFLAQVCADWEHEAARAQQSGIRTVSMRTGVVLDSGGGALAKMVTPFRYGVGGPLGSGKQFFPWIHRDDLVRAYVFALEHDDISGAVNAVAPDYVRNRRLAQALGAAVDRPALLPAPGFALRAVLGEFSQTVLGGALVVPAILQDAGFTWRFDTLEPALGSIFGTNGAASLLHEFGSSQLLPRSRNDVFSFFSDPHNLEAITPPTLNFRITRAPARLERGAIIEYRLLLHGVPMSWKTLIARWDPPYAFEDVQLSGPYALWRHEHTFTESGAGTMIEDAVTYALPAHPFSAIAQRFVASEVGSIFSFRRDAIARI